MKRCRSVRENLQKVGNDLQKRKPQGQLHTLVAVGHLKDQGNISKEKSTTKKEETIVLRQGSHVSTEGSQESLEGQQIRRCNSRSSKKLQSERLSSNSKSDR